MKTLNEYILIQEISELSELSESDEINEGLIKAIKKMFKKVKKLILDNPKPQKKDKGFENLSAKYSDYSSEEIVDEITRHLKNENDTAKIDICEEPDDMQYIKDVLNKTMTYYGGNDGFPKINKLINSKSIANTISGKPYNIHYACMQYANTNVIDVIAMFVFSYNINNTDKGNKEYSDYIQLYEIDIQQKYKNMHNYICHKILDYLINVNSDLKNYNNFDGFVINSNCGCKQLLLDNGFKEKQEDNILIKDIN